VSDAIKPAMHGRDHLPGGSDPIPVIPGTSVSAAIYRSDIAGFDSRYLLGTGSHSYFIGFSGLSTNDPDSFLLKGSSSPYKAKLAPGYYQWLVELDFQQYPLMLANGSDTSNGADYGEFASAPTWNNRLEQPHQSTVTVTPGTTVPLTVAAAHFSGFMNVTAISDLEVAVVTANVISGGSYITACTLNLIRYDDFLPDASSNTTP